MKKIALLFIVITSSLVYTGCTKDENEPLNLPDPIIGKWEFQSKYSREGANTTTNPNEFVLQTPTSTTPLTDCELNKVATFESTGTYAYSYTAGTNCTPSNGTYSREFSNKYNVTSSTGASVLYTNFGYEGTQLTTYQEVKDANQVVTHTIKTVYKKATK